MSSLPVSFPLVTVLVPFYQGQDTIAETVDSVLGQEYPSLELLIINDASPNDTAACLSVYEEDERIRVITHERNKGLNQSLKTGIVASRGEYLCILGQDDLMMPGRLAWQVPLIKKLAIDALYASHYHWPDGESYESSSQLIDLTRFHTVLEKESQQALLERYVYQATPFIHYPMSQSGLFTRQALLDALPLREQFELDDYPLLVYLLENKQVRVMNQPSFYYRIRSNSMARSIWKNAAMTFQVSCQLIPETQRLKSIGNLCFNLGNFFFRQRDVASVAMVWFIAAFVFNPTFQYAPTVFKYLRHRVKKLFRRKRAVHAL